MTAPVRWRFAQSRLNWIAGKRKGWLFRLTVHGVAKGLVRLVYLKAAIEKKNNPRSKPAPVYRNSPIQNIIVYFCTSFSRNCRTSCCTIEKLIRLQSVCVTLPLLRRIIVLRTALCEIWYTYFYLSILILFFFFINNTNIHFRSKIMRKLTNLKTHTF